MKKIICAVLVAFSFCLINSGDASARTVERGRIENEKIPGAYSDYKRITKNNGTIVEKWKHYDENGNQVGKGRAVIRPEKNK